MTILSEAELHALYLDRYGIAEDVRSGRLQEASYGFVEAAQWCAAQGS